MTQPPRIADIAAAPMTPRQQQVHDAIASGPRGVVEGPLRVWLHSPELADKAQQLGQFARYDSTLPPILSELAILVTARIWSSGFEWSTHAPIAAQAGLPPAVIEDIAYGRCPDLGGAQRAVFDYAVELHRDRAVSDRTHDAAAAELGAVGVVDLVAVCGYYTLISMTINAFHVPDGDGPRLPQLPTPSHELFRDRGPQRR